MNTRNEKFSNKPFNIFGLLFWLLLSAVVAWFGAQFNPGLWYMTINKPIWTPPGWLFGPVWTMLYIMMAIASYLVWNATGRTFKNKIIQLYLFKMLLNACWSWVFFGLHQIGWAVINIILLLVFIIVVTTLFYRQNKISGWLMLPYLLWVSFASILNLNIWILNR